MRLEGRIGSRRRRGVDSAEAEWAVAEVGAEEVREVLEGREPAFAVFLRSGLAAESAAHREAYATLAAADFAVLRALSGARAASEREPRPEWVARVRSRIRRRRRSGVERLEAVRAIAHLGAERVRLALEAEEPFGLGCARAGAAGAKDEEPSWVALGAAGARVVRDALALLEEREGRVSAEAREAAIKAGGGRPAVRLLTEEGDEVDGTQRPDAPAA